MHTVTNMREDKDHLYKLIIRFVTAFNALPLNFSMYVFSFVIHCTPIFSHRGPRGANACVLTEVRAADQCVLTEVRAVAKICGLMSYLQSTYGTSQYKKPSCIETDTLAIRAADQYVFTEVRTADQCHIECVLPEVRAADQCVLTEVRAADQCVLTEVLAADQCVLTEVRAADQCVLTEVRTSNQCVLTKVRTADQCVLTEVRAAHTRSAQLMLYVHAMCSHRGLCTAGSYELSIFLKRSQGFPLTL